MNLPKCPYSGVNIPEGGDGKKGQMRHIIMPRYNVPLLGLTLIGALSMTIVLC